MLTISRRPRNPVARSPLLRKGGMHQKAKSGQRAEAKLHMQQEAENWREALDETDGLTTFASGGNPDADFLLSLKSLFRLR